MDPKFDLPIENKFVIRHPHCEAIRDMAAL